MQGRTHPSAQLILVAAAAGFNGLLTLLTVSSWGQFSSAVSVSVLISLGLLWTLWLS